MKLPRRKFLYLAAGAAALPAVSRIAGAQAYPTRPVRIIVGHSGRRAQTIMVARLIGQWLSERFGQQFVIENRPGAGGNIGTEAAVRAPADGYTLLLFGTTQTINATLYDKLNFDFIRDIAPVAPIIRLANVLDGQSCQYQPKPFRSSSRTRRPIQARSTWRQSAPAARRMSRVSCSR